MKVLKKFVKTFINLSICTCLVIVYAFKVEPLTIVTHVYELNEKAVNSDQILRVVQLSDIHISESYTTKKLNHLVNEVNQLSPHIIVFTGDLFDNFAEYGPVQETTDALGKLEASYGKYAIYGNRDYGGGAVRKYESILVNAGFTVLKNDGTILTVANGKRIFIGGLDDALLGNPDIDSTLKEIDVAYDYTIMLMHEPDMADYFKESSVDLILAGHSHGGQVRIPFFNEVTTSLAEKYTKGFYTINEGTEMLLYVNTGIGTTHIPIRFMVPPEIAVFDIKL